MIIIMHLHPAWLVSSPAEPYQTYKGLDLEREHWWLSGCLQFHFTFCCVSLEIQNTLWRVL